MTVACVIVTFNRLAMLQEAVTAVLDQTRNADRIILVDNKSTDGTAAWIEEIAESEPRISPLLLERNYGGAGGFHYGMRKAYDAGMDWIWVMDDDTIPGKDALENLLDAASLILSDESQKLGFLASQVNWIDGSRHEMNRPEPAFAWWDGFDGIPGTVRLKQASFVSLLIRRQAVETVGFPVKEFFIWRDDAEFTRRISLAGLSNYYIEASKVVHATPTNRGVDYKDIDKKNLWKWKYGIRNEVAMAREEKYGVLASLLWFGYDVVRLFENRVPLSLKLPLILAGLKGFFFNYRKFIVYPSTGPEVTKD